MIRRSASRPTAPASTSASWPSTSIFSRSTRSIPKRAQWASNVTGGDRVRRRLVADDTDAACERPAATAQRRESFAARHGDRHHTDAVAVAAAVVREVGAYAFEVRRMWLEQVHGRSRATSCDHSIGADATTDVEHDRRGQDPALHEVIHRLEQRSEQHESDRRMSRMAAEHRQGFRRQVDGEPTRTTHSVPEQAQGSRCEAPQASLPHRRPQASERPERTGFVASTGDARGAYPDHSGRSLGRCA